ncbi:protein PFC0760c-like isoform X2 [Mytilus trossulus]|uniref:protein PFC0760c-like isoform X2 n=1 Tax=Mytilus trossulus TaxID=6551 RepID=UPI003007BEC9
MNLFKLLPGVHIVHKDVMDSSTPGWIYLVLTWVCVYGVTTTQGATIATTTSVNSTSILATTTTQQTTTLNVTSTTTNQNLASVYAAIDITTVADPNVTDSNITSTDSNTVIMDTTISMMPHNTTANVTTEVTIPVNSTTKDDNVTTVINATTTFMQDNVTTFINATTQIITGSSNDTKMIKPEALSSEIASIAGAVSGVVVVCLVIIAIILCKKKTDKSLGKRYEVKSRAFTESMAFADNRESKMSNNDLQRISDGNQNYHMIDEETFMSKRKDNGSSENLINRKQNGGDITSEKEENDSRASDSGIEVNLDEKVVTFKPKASAKIEGNDKEHDGDVEHVYTKSVKRGKKTENDSPSVVHYETKDKSKQNFENREVIETNENDKKNGDEDIEDDDEVYANAYSAPLSESIKAVNNFSTENKKVTESKESDKTNGDEDIQDDDEVYVNAYSVSTSDSIKQENSFGTEDKHKIEQNSKNLKVEESKESEKTNGDEGIEDDDEVYANAYSASSSNSIKAVSSELCIEALRSAVEKKDTEDVYDFAVPIEADEKDVEKTKNETEISLVNLNIVAKDHYEDSKETPIKLETFSEDAIYYNEQEDDDDDVIYHNNEMDNNTTTQENSEDDTYDCATSTVSHEKTSDDIYDSTKDSDYDVTHHESEKKRFFIRPSTDDNYDHCELPTEREDYDLVELPDNC